MLTRNGTDGRVYGGDCNLVHIADGKRKEAGAAVAAFIDSMMRFNAMKAGKNADGVLCPGCYMIAGFNSMLELADANGQPRKELAKTMAAAFAKLSENPEAGGTEEINVILDND